MYPLTTELLQRVGALMPDARDYFRAVKKWYGDSQLAFRAVRALVARSSAAAKVDLLVNDRQIAGGGLSVHAQSKELNWTLEPKMLREGRNRIVVSVDPHSEAKLFLKQATVEQERDIGTHAVDLTQFQPAGTHRFALDPSLEAKFDGDVWRIPPGGHLSFRLEIERAAPVAFSLTVLQEKGDLSGVLKEIRKKVKETRQQLEDQRASVERTNPKRAEELTNQIADLTDYLRLHSAQIEPAFTGGDDGTLAEVIARVGNPDQWIAESHPPVDLIPEIPKAKLEQAPAPQPQPPIRTIQPTPRREPPPRRDPVRMATSAATTAAPVVAAPGLGAGATVLLLFGGAILMLVGLGYAGVSLVKPTSTSTAIAQANGPTDKYYIWIVGGHNEIIVGRRSVIEDAESRSLSGWGLEPTKVKDLKPPPAWAAHAGPFETAAEAKAAYEEMLIPGTTRDLPLAMGLVSKFKFDGGKERHMENALRFNR
jgi:hypothetical protein